MFKKMIIALVVVFAFSAVSAMACDGCAAHKASATKTTKVEKAKHADFEGTLVCLGCDLKKTEGARAACSAHGHTHALKTTDGKYINFLANQYSTDLLKGEKYSKKKLAVHGIYYANANQLDVETFTIEGKKMGWCDHCKSMDGCAATKGSM